MPVYMNKKEMEIMQVVNSLGSIKVDQLKKIHNIKKDDYIHSAVKKKLIKIDGDILLAISEKKVNEKMLSAVELYSIFKNSVSWFQKADSPFTLSIIMNAKLYDLAVIDYSEEKLMSNILSRTRSENMIIICSSEESLKDINIDDTIDGYTGNTESTKRNIGYCTINPFKRYVKTKTGEIKQV